MSEMRLCGIDSSTQKTGISLFVNGKYKDSILINHSSCKDSELRVDMMIHSIIEKLDEWKPQIVAIEDDWNKQNVQVTKALSEIIGSVHGYADTNKLDFHKMMPSRWRSFMGWEIGKKTRPELKQMAIDYVKEKYNIEANDDQCESICIAEALVNYFETLN